MNFTAVHFVPSVTVNSQKLQSVSLVLEMELFSHCPRFMNIVEDRNKDRLKNWRLCGVWKLPCCDHRGIKLTQNCVCFINPCVSLLVPDSVTRAYHPKLLQLLDLMLQCIAAYFQHALSWVSGET